MNELPLSRAQSGIWYAQQRDPASPAFNCAEYVRIRGPVDVDLLRKALRRAVNETGTLTAHVSAESGEPRQVLGAVFDGPIHVRDVAAEPDPCSAALETMRSDAGTPLDLLRDCPVRFMIFQLGERCGHDVLWYLLAHHLVLDGFGFAALIRRTAEIYTATDRDEAPPECPFSPLEELIAAERAYRNSGDLDSDREFWLDRMDGRRNVASLVERPLPPARHVLHRRGALDGGTVRALDEVAGGSGVSWPELTVAGMAAYVYKVAGTTSVVLGLPVLARYGQVTTSVATTAVNVLPLPLTVDPDADLLTLARQVRTELATVRSHQRYRHEDLRRDLNLVGNSRRLFGPQVNIKPFGHPPRFGDRAATVHYLASGPVEDIELTVHTAAPGGTLGFDLAANPELYDRDELDAHYERLRELLERAAAGHASDRTVARLDATTSGERGVIEASNATEHDVAAGTLIEKFEAAAERMPDGVALRFRGRELRYAELNARADRLARLLRREYAITDGVVAVALPRSFDLVVALLATLKCGAAYLPVDPAYPNRRISFMLADAKPACVLTTKGMAGRLAGARGRNVLELDDPTTHADLARTMAEPPPREPGRVRDPAYVIYTSGSTGTPKGVVVSHEAIVNRLEWMQHAFVLRDDDRVLQKTPAGFDVSVWEFFWPLLHGATMVIAEPEGHRDPAYLADVIEQESITTVHFVPSMLDVFLGEPVAARSTSLRRVICSGEPLTGDLAKRCHDRLRAPLYNLYGPTEAAVDVSWWRCVPGEETIPIGRPVWNTRLHVLDAGLRPVPPGVTGELYIAGVQLAEGYLGRPELTAERFVADTGGERMYRTGDLARRRPDGVLEYAGRIDDQVKIRGVRIEPGEIEAALRNLDDIRQAAVVTTRVAGTPSLVGYVAGEGGSDPEPAAIRRELAATLPSSLVPAYLVAVPELPLTANGKLDRDALPEPAARTAQVGEAPRSPREQALCELFAETLELPAVVVTDDFFDLGGHSLSAVTLVRRLRDELGVEVGLDAVFTASSPRALASRLESDSTDRSLDLLLPLRDGASSPPLYCVHPAGGIGWCYAGLARALPEGRPLVAVQARGLDGATRLAGSIEEMAADYVDAIRSSGGGGPYYLLGWSVGGIVAHAMAARLQELGERVRMLAMLDAYPSDLWRGLDAPSEEKALLALLYTAGYGEDVLNGQRSDRATVLSLLRREGSALGSLTARTLSAVIDVVTNNARLMRDHTHRVFDGDLHFFTATAPRSETWLYRDAWAPYVTGGIVNHDLDCTHPNLVRSPALDEIARVLATRLHRAEA